MQVKDQTVTDRNKYSVLGTVLKGVVTFLCIYFLWVQLQKQEVDFSNSEWYHRYTWTLIAVSMLMILNWYLEALRWKISLAPFEKITIKEAWYSVLTGLALNWILPFTSGDFAARLISRKDKYQTTSAIILNRFIMLLLTISFGFFSFIYVEQSIIQWNKIYLILIAGIIISLFFLRGRLSKFLFFFRNAKIEMLVKVSLISILRYALFTFQFFMLVLVFNPELSSLVILAGIGWIFLMRSVIPHLLGGIGLREAASIVFFTPHVGEISQILIPVFLIWIINTVIPSLFGLSFIWNKKWA